MKTSDIRNMGIDEINAEVDRLRDQLFHLRAQAVTEKLHDPTQLKKARRSIAQLLTIRRERERSGAGH